MFPIKIINIPFDKPLLEVEPMDTNVFIPFILFCFLLVKSIVAVDTIAPNGTLHDTGQTLISTDGSFEFGFFNPWNSNNRYIGIWFKKVSKTVFWVANKNSPLSDSSGILSLTTAGNIIISNNQSTIWSSNSSARNPVLQLLNTGNLVVKDSSGSYMWQSFDHPCDTLIPGMKLGLNFKTGQEWYLTSWKNLQDPSDGDYTYKFDRNGLPQIVLHRGTVIEYRSGPWDGVRFGGGPALAANPVFSPIFVFNQTFLYYSFKNNEDSIISRFVVNQTGLIQHLSWSKTSSDWVETARVQSDNCDSYGYCGPNGICEPNGSPICQCPTGFVPRVPEDWQRLQWSGGCVKKTESICGVEEGFRKFSGLKLPDNSNILVNSQSVDCENACLKNCSCLAYAKTDASGCVMWYGDLVDIKQYNQGGEDLFIRMATSEVDSGKKGKRMIVIVSVVVVASVVLLLGLVSWYAFFKRKKTVRGEEDQTAHTEDNPLQDYNKEMGEGDLELPLFDLATIATATDDFSFRNKLGEGGFGPVYKGTLSTGQEIAVKRLSKESGQGLKELKNEIILISKLQHRNLVKLLGFCIQGEERMLIYEYMHNKSLDFFIFDKKEDTSLNWQKRFNIIVGIARGLVYLHRDSRLRIIHRDLKASNILLDHDMQPKISDFGLARMFRADQTEAETNRVIGTYGYMSPEYALEGVFSEKSDVFSFGVLVLEIVSGKRNKGFYHTDHDLNLLGHAWKLWIEDRPLELVNAFIKKLVPESDVLRCIQVGLLCVQQRPDDRPTISYVLLMLDSENATLPQPKQPGFYTERFLVDTDSSSTGKYPMASNEGTASMLLAR